MSMIYSRQNEKIALHYLRASEYCFKKEKIIKYFMIVISVLLIIVSIVFNVVPESAVELRKIVDESSKYLTFISGVYIVGSMFLSRSANRAHIEGVNILELYDNFVFNIPVNKTILRSINDLTINNYAERYRQKESKLMNRYFKFEHTTESKTVSFDHYKNIYNEDYKLITRITGFYHFIWISFIILIFLFAVYFDRSFVESLSNILIPSLSAISLIFSSWHSMSEDKAFLQKVIKILQEMESDAVKGAITLSSPLVIRSLQDGLFAYRLRSFMVPNFLIKSFKKAQIKETTAQFINSQEFQSLQDRQLRADVTLEPKNPKRKRSVPEVKMVKEPVKQEKTTQKEKKVVLESANTESILTTTTKTTPIKKTSPKTTKKVEEEKAPAKEGVTKSERPVKEAVTKSVKSINKQKQVNAKIKK